MSTFLLTARHTFACIVMMIGDSISMGGFGYSLFVQDMLQTYTNGTLAGSVQHGGGFGGGGQVAYSPIDNKTTFLGQLCPLPMSLPVLKIHLHFFRWHHRLMVPPRLHRALVTPRAR